MSSRGNRRQQILLSQCKGSLDTRCHCGNRIDSTAITQKILGRICLLRSTSIPWRCFFCLCRCKQCWCAWAGLSADKILSKMAEHGAQCRVQIRSFQPKPDPLPHVFVCLHKSSEYRNYSIYVHGHFLPWVSQERAYKKLGKGDMFITIDRRSGLDGVYRWRGRV